MEIFKPTVRKIVFTVVLTMGLPYLIAWIFPVPPVVINCITWPCPTGLSQKAFFPFNLASDGPLNLIVNLVFWYVIVCLGALIFNKKKL